MGSRNRRGHLSRLWPTCVSVLAFAGCAGTSSIEGRWKGPLPLADANDCTIKLRENGHFEALCRSTDPDTPEWAGVGLYRFDGKALELEFKVLARRGAGHPPGDPIKLDVKAGGNHLSVAGGGLTTPVDWTRSME